MSIGEVWLATQIPPFLGLFSLQRKWQHWNQRQRVKPVFFKDVVHNRKAFVPVVIANRGRESSSTDSVTHHVDQLTEPELYPKNKYLQGKKMTHCWEKISIIVLFLMYKIKKKNNIFSHLQFGSNPTADVPITNQLTPMMVNVILEREWHISPSSSRSVGV